MHRFLFGSAIFLFSLEASNTVTQTITFSVSAISEIAVSGNPPPFLTTTAAAGSNPSDVIDTSTFYAVTTNGVSQKVSAALDNDMPQGTMLCLMASAPTGATSTGNVDLTAISQDVVTGITEVAQSNLQLSYVFEATASAGVVPLTTRVVTFTLSP